MCSFHPYLFFNEDGASITFVGFNANRHGDLLDPTRNSVIEHGAISPQLYEGITLYSTTHIFCDRMCSLS